MIHLILFRLKLPPPPTPKNLGFLRPRIRQKPKRAGMMTTAIDWNGLLLRCLKGVGILTLYIIIISTSTIGSIVLLLLSSLFSLLSWLVLLQIWLFAHIDCNLEFFWSQLQLVSRPPLPEQVGKALQLTFLDVSLSFVTEVCPTTRDFDVKQSAFCFCNFTRLHILFASLDIAELWWA